jgi:hypothetical protein
LQTPFAFLWFGFTLLVIFISRHFAAFCRV